MALTPKAFCLYAQEEIARVVTDPTLKDLQPTGLLTALDSPANSIGVDLLRVDRQGKKVRLDIKYFPADCIEASTGTPEPCAAGEVSTDNSQYITLEQDDNNYIYRKYTFNEEEFRTLCDSKDGRISRKILDLVRNVLLSERAYYNAAIYGALNNYFDGTNSLPGGAEKTLNLFNATGIRQGMGLFKLIKEYQLKGYTETPIIVGGSTISAWLYANGIFGSNTDGAADGGGVNAYIDYNTAMYGATAVGDSNERVLSWIPGHNQAIRWFKYEGDFAKSKDNITKTTMFVGNQKFDMSLYDDGCGDVILTVGRGNTLFNIGGITPSTCAAQPSTLNWIADCGDLTCDVVKQPIPEQGS
jgi:hypothetical protein